MGIITNLIEQHHRRDIEAKQAEAEALGAVLRSNPSDKAREWALQGLNELAMTGGKKGGKGGGGGGFGDTDAGLKGKGKGFHPAVAMLGVLSGMNPFSAGGGTKQAIQGIEAGRPKQLSMSTDEMVAREALKDQAKQQAEMQRQIAVERDRLKQEHEYKVQETKERVEAFDKVADRLYKDPEQRARARITAEFGYTLPKDEKLIVGEAKNVTLMLPTQPGQPGRAMSAIQEIQPDGKPKFYGIDGNELHPPPGTDVRTKEPGAGGDKGMLGELESAQDILANRGMHTSSQVKAAELFVKNYQAGTTEKSVNAAFNSFMARGAGVPGLGGSQGGGGTPPATPVAGGATAPARIPTSPVKQKNINEFIFRSLNPGMPGRDKYTSARMQDGLNSLMEQTGMSAEQLTTAIQERKDDFKALNQRIDQFRAYQTLEERLKADGGLLKQARRKLPDAKLKVLNSAIVNGLTQVNDPEVNKYLVAVNALSRTYSIAVSNGFQSRAMPPVTNMQEANKLIGPALSTGAVDAIVDQLESEVKANSNAMGNVWRQQIDSLSKPLGVATGPPGGGGGGGAATSGGVPKVGETFNGQKVLKVEKIQ